MRYSASLLEVSAIPRTPCPIHQRLYSLLGILALVLCIPCSVVAQSGPSLSYSTYLPKLNFLPISAGNIAILSVDSTGAACVTDGSSLFGYDSNGNVTFTVDIISMPPRIGAGTVFRDAHGNCFVAGVGSSNSQGISPLAVAKFSPTGSLIYAKYFGSNAMGSIFVQPSQIVSDSLGNAYVIGITNFPDFPMKNSIQNLLQGQIDAFIMKLDPTE